MTVTRGDDSGFTAHPTVRELEKISNRTDTRDVLAHASKSARKLNDYFIVDIDAHVTETAFWSEITDRIDNDYLRHAALSFRERGGSPPGLLNVQPGMLYQDMFGRIPHGQQADAVIGEGTHRQVELVRRAMDSMGIDYTVAFPTPMLLLGMHPQAEVEVALGRAFNRWLVEELLPREPRIKAMMYLPFNDPEACVEVVEEFADAPGVIGFTVVSTRYKPVHHNSYMRLYAALQATGKPLAFHSGFHWGDESMKQMNRFISMHAISFCYFNMIHLTNWIINGLPERFPELKVIWVESGLAWLPFMMQRLDSEYHDALVRGTDAAATAQRVYPRHVFHQSAAGDQQSQAYAGDDGSDQGRYAVVVRVRLAALGFRSADDDHRPAVPVGAGEAQHPGPERRACVRLRGAGQQACPGARA